MPKPTLYTERLNVFLTAGTIDAILAALKPGEKVPGFMRAAIAAELARRAGRKGEGK